MMAGLLRAGIRRFSPNVAFRRNKTTYVVLLPEAPLDTAEDNALLRTDDLPAFEELTPEKCYMGMGKLALEYEAGVWSVEEKIKKNQEPINFSNIIESLEVLDAPLSIAWSNVKTLYTVKNNEMNTSVYRQIHERARKARVHKFQSLPIYQACKDILLNEQGLNEAQQRVLRKYLLEARLNGIELSQEKKDTFSHTLNKLERQKGEFRKKVDESTSRFAYRIHDPFTLKQFPDDLKSNMQVPSGRIDGPWDVTLRPQVYHKFLEYCPDPALRQNTWRAYNMRASHHLSEEVNNSAHLEEIRTLRQEQANILGYENFAQMSMETKMAGSVENVLSMITSLMAKSNEAQEKELDSLQKFATDGGHFGEVDPWDVAYWRRKQKRHLYNFEESQHKEFFPFDHVFGSMLELCSQLFNISFEELESGQVSTWHPDVRFLNILDSDGSYLASIYLDPFKRMEEKLYTGTTQAWMLGCRNRSDIAKTSPISTLVFNFTPPSEEYNNNCLLTFSEVQILFRKFGHALQHLLTTVPYSEASGLTNIEWDAVEVCANFMQYWLYDPATLQRISCHHQSGLPLSGSSIKDLIVSQNHMAAYDLCNELHLSHLDLQFHTSKDYWFDITKELWPKYKIFPFDKYYAQPLSFTEIMTDIWGSAYYSSTWAKMLAADAFQTYNESTEDDIDEIGQRFRDTFLSLGGGCHPSEVFRRFRGRDPSPESLLTLYDLGTTTSSS